MTSDPNIPPAKDTSGAEFPSAEVEGDVVNSRELFQGQREIWIVHDGERYRLRITRRNKLILQK